MNATRVLVVEDDEALRDSVRDLLEWEGCKVETAADGQAAVDLLTRAKELPQVIFLDLNMPKMSGQDFLVWLLEQPAPLKDIPVVVMTALPNIEIPGVKGLLRKPMDIEQIIDKLNQIRRN